MIMLVTIVLDYIHLPPLWLRFIRLNWIIPAFNICGKVAQVLHGHGSFPPSPSVSPGGWENLEQQGGSGSLEAAMIGPLKGFIPRRIVNTHQAMGRWKSCRYQKNNNPGNWLKR